MTGRLLDPTLVEALNRLAAGARRTALGFSGGLHRSPFKGASVDFRQHRGYVPGDDPRRLDWRVLARTDRPFVREYDDETTLRTLVAVDASGSMAYAARADGAGTGAGTGTGAGAGAGASKFDDARRLAAALAYVMLAGGESAGLLVAGASPAWVPGSAAASQLSRVIEALEVATAAGATTFDAVLAGDTKRVGRRALVLLVSDLMLPPERLRRALARLRHGRHDVVVVRVLHPHETTFPFRGFVRFRGAEREPAVMVQATAARERYLENFNAHGRALRSVCRATGAAFVEHAVGRPVIDTLRAIVRRGRA